MFWDQKSRDELDKPIDDEDAEDEEEEEDDEDENGKPKFYPKWGA